LSHAISSLCACGQCRLRRIARAALIGNLSASAQDSLRVDLFIKGDTKTVVLNPGNRAGNGADIVEVDGKARPANHLHAFAHQSGSRKIAHFDAIMRRILLQQEISQLKPRGAILMSPFDLSHANPHYLRSANMNRRTPEPSDATDPNAGMAKEELTEFFALYPQQVTVMSGFQTNQCLNRRAISFPAAHAPPAPRPSWWRRAARSTA